MEQQIVNVSNSQNGSKLYIFILTLFIFGCSTTAYGAKYTGTFSSLVYHQEAGDLLGVEMKIVYTRKGYQASLQIAEGGISELIIVKPIIKDRDIKFTIESPDLYKGDFKGVIDDSNLKGILKYSTGGELEFNLPKKKSYWD